MATEVTIGGDGVMFVGEDKLLRFEVLDKTYDPAIPGSGVPLDMQGWTLLFDVRMKDTSPDPAMFSAAPSIVGIYDPIRSQNTQRAVVTLTDNDLDLFKAKTYRHSLKRMDPGSETVLVFGDFVPQKATAP